MTEDEQNEVHQIVITSLMALEDQDQATNIDVKCENGSKEVQNCEITTFRTRIKKSAKDLRLR